MAAEMILRFSDRAPIRVQYDKLSAAFVPGESARDGDGKNEPHALFVQYPTATFGVLFDGDVPVWLFKRGEFTPEGGSSLPMLWRTEVLDGFNWEGTPLV